METCIEAYLDIETTGLSPLNDELTVVGVYICNGDETRFVQLVGDDITADKILEALKNVDLILTYNGSRFDLPFINCRLGIDLAQMFKHRDLMLDCWSKNLYGGFKAVEKKLGIKRILSEMNGLEAIKLWWQYINYYDENALDTLLEYNKEDVVNLKTLKERLA